MLIELIGMDAYRVGEVSRLVQPKIQKNAAFQSYPILFSGSESSLYHDGVDQNTWIVVVKIYLEEALISFASSLQTMILDALKEDTIHVQFITLPLPSTALRLEKHEDYPLYVSENSEEDEENSIPQDIFLGNAFEKHQDALDEQEKVKNPFSDDEDEAKH